MVGVLELVLDDHDTLSDDQVEVLETLSIHAAAALEAARLHQTTSHASEHDPLTRLANRRRLEADLTMECDRSLRYASDFEFYQVSPTDFHPATVVELICTAADEGHTVVVVD